MSTPIRGTEAVKAMRDLFDAYLTECDRIDSFKAKFGSNLSCVLGEDLADWIITAGERLEVFERRRDAIAAKLENKGFKVTPEAGNDTLPSIAKAQAEMGA